MQLVTHKSVFKRNITLGCFYVKYNEHFININLQQTEQCNNSHTLTHTHMTQGERQTGLFSLYRVHECLSDCSVLVNYY